MRGILIRIKKRLWRTPQLLLLTSGMFFIMTVFMLLTLDKSQIFAEYTKLLVHFIFLFGCLAVYKIIYRIFGSLFSYREERILELHLLIVSFAFALNTAVSSLLDLNFYIFYDIITIILFLFITYLLLLCFYRLMRRKKDKSIGNEKRRNNKHIAIIGAGEAGKRLFEEIQKNPDTQYRVWSFFDDDRKIIGRKINGVLIRGPINSIGEILRESPVCEIILAIPTLSDKRRREILDMCSSMPYTIKILPDSMLATENENKKYTTSIRAINLNDLLGRSSVHLKNEELGTFLEDKVILVTGGGGSIGSELCRQIGRYRPRKLIILDIIENTAYLLKNELDYTSKGSLNVCVAIASICDFNRMNHIFQIHQPDLVFHAAAHKHVPLMENDPSEAIKTNILATYNLAKLTAEYGCEKFVMLSTDKAVNPTNVMGASKRYCEMIIQAMSDTPNCKTDFVAVRFGNVLGSSGSVVPIFVNQIEHGGPITLTDKRIIRYFMTIPEAVSLVLKAGAMAQDSEVFVLDMGEPVKILTLAENLIRITGYIPYKEIDIIETGLRPGEKLYEELLVDKETNAATDTEKIFIEKQLNKIKISEIEKGIYHLENIVDSNDNELIVATLKKLVPTFKTPEEVNSRVGSVPQKKKESLCTA